jgi:phytoene dehydrogenase-like protein
VSTRAVIIGAGANELVAAHLLARSGWSVLVFDPHESHPDTDAGWVAPQIVRALDLDLEVRRPDPWVSVSVANGERLELWNDAARSAESIRRYSATDAARWPAFCERMALLARALESIAMAPAPDPVGEGFDAIVDSLAAALRVRRLVGRGIEDLLRLVSMPVADVLDDWFECDALKGALGAAGIRHLRQGPRSGGTALNFLQQHAGCAPGVFRPAASNLRRVLAKSPGVEIRRASVARVAVAGGLAKGVVLDSGEEIPADQVFSGIDPRSTLLELVEPAWLDPEFVRTLRGIRSRGAVAQVTLALDREPGFSILAIAPSLDYLERAYDDAKYGRLSRQPYLEAHGEGRQVQVHVQYLNGSADAARDSVADLVVRTLDAHLPGFGGAVTSNVVLLPSDLEKSFGWPDGQMHHAEPLLDQWLWMRPTPELAHYRTPIGGLYLCGPAMHPGGWMPGACGYHAAREALREVRGAPGRT